MPFHTGTSKANPPRKPIVFPTICTGRVQRQPRRMPSPKTPNKAAIAQESRKETIRVNFEPTVVCLEKIGEPRKIDKIGIKSSSTVRPQSKETAIPIPLGAGSFSAPLCVEFDCSVSFKVVSLSKEMQSRSAFYNTLAVAGGECVGVHGGATTVNPNTFRLLCFSHNRSYSLDNVISTDACFLHQFVRCTGARH
jgi:hypothetical protein